MQDTTNHGAPGVAAFIQQRQEETGISDADLAIALGYANAKAVGLIKSGTMKVPLNKVSALGHALQTDAFDLLRMIVSESAPGLWNALQEIAAPLGALQPAEINLLRHVRRLGSRGQMTPVVFEGRGVIALVAV